MYENPIDPNEFNKWVLAAVLSALTWLVLIQLSM